VAELAEQRDDALYIYRRNGADRTTRAEIAKVD
jgi:hypothetical protein